MNNNSLNTNQVSDTTGSQTLGGFGYTIVLSMAVLVIFAIMTYVSYVCKKAREGLPRGSIDASTTHDNSSIVTVYQDGLDDLTISSCPKFTYDQVKLHKSDSTASGCSICLADYKEKDLIRMLPDCGHFYHLACIDTWLGIHTTCPICRSSPLHTPLTPAAQIRSQ